MVCEDVETNKSMNSNEQQLKAVFTSFHMEIMQALDHHGRQEPPASLELLRNVNEKKLMISPVPFNLVARAALSS